MFGQSSFDLASAVTIGFEGGYSPGRQGDPGGETKYGISKRQYPKIEIKDLTIPEAKKLYKRDYWDNYHCSELPTPLALCFFDAVVNHAPENPIKWLQSAVGAKADGLLGPQTLRLAKACENINRACADFTTSRVEYVKTLSNYPQNPGWHRRHIHVLSEALRYA